MNQAQTFECDDELHKQTGDNFFVTYAEDTKMQTFKSEAEANTFRDKMNAAPEESHTCRYCKRELTAATWEKRRAWNPKEQKPDNYFIYLCGDKKGCHQE